MTQVNAKKLAILIKTTERYLPMVKANGMPFAASAAKYYPALKKLASE